MKKKVAALCAVLLIACVLLTACAVMTPTGALRLRLLTSGYPLQALVLRLSDTPNRMQLQENQTGYSLDNPPVERDTQAELVNWVVTKHGLFYTADYYGWG